MAKALARPRVAKEILTKIKNDLRLAAPKILIFDIETAPNISYVWGHYDQNVIAHVEEWYMLSFAYKWLGEKDIHVRSLPDYKGYKAHTPCDKGLVQDLWQLFDEADIIIAHNGDSFDIKKANSRFIYHGLTPPSPYQTIDTLKLARKYFKFNSNKLDDLGFTLGLGRKVVHTGFSLWKGCMGGDMPSWETMCKYNKQDVVLLEKVYMKLRVWHDKHPSVSAIQGRKGCPVCGGLEATSRGTYISPALYSAPRLHCKNPDCGKYYLGARTKIKFATAGV